MYRKYDILLTQPGNDALSTAFVVMNIIQQMSPVPVLNISDARDWLEHIPILLRRGITHDEAHLIQWRLESLGAEVAIIPTELFFPEDMPGITLWRNEWFSEHLVALHENMLEHWAQDNAADEAYRFSYFPSLGFDMTIRLWREGGLYFGNASRSIGSIGPLPGPPGLEAHWTPTAEDWQRLCETMQSHHFWNSESWNTVPDGYVVLDSAHWIVEGWRERRYHALFDQTPDEGAAREVGLLLLDLLPDSFKQHEIEE